jgi:hypothetical protein
MITDKGKLVCDREVKVKTKKGDAWRWRGCRRPAVVEVKSTKVSGLYLHYCARHS